MAIASQRFLDAGGDPRHPPSGLKGDDYMTDAERQEALTIARSLTTNILKQSWTHSPRCCKGLRLFASLANDRSMFQCVQDCKTYLEKKRQNNLQPQIN